MKYVVWTLKLLLGLIFSFSYLCMMKVLYCGLNKPCWMPLRSFEHWATTPSSSPWIRDPRCPYRYLLPMVPKSETLIAVKQPSFKTVEWRCNNPPGTLPLLRNIIVNEYAKQQTYRSNDLRFWRDIGARKHAGACWRTTTLRVLGIKMVNSSYESSIF